MLNCYQMGPVKLKKAKLNLKIYKHSAVKSTYEIRI